MKDINVLGEDGSIRSTTPNLVVCEELTEAYKEDVDPLVWMKYPDHFRPPYARIVTTALIRRQSSLFEANSEKGDCAQRDAP